MHLAHARDAEGRRVRPVADRFVVLRGLDVHDDVAPRKRRLDRRFDAVGGGVSLPDCRAGWHRDDDVGEVAAARLAHPQPVERHGGLDGGDRLERRRLGIGRGAVHEHVDVHLHQTRGGDEHEHRDEQRRGRVGTCVTGPHEQQPEQHSPRPDQVAAEVERVGRERRARVAARRAPAHDRPAEVDDDHEADHRQRVPGRPDRRLPAADEVGDRTPRDEAADHGKDCGLGERTEVLGLAVAVLVSDVRRPDRDADREEGQQGRDQVGAGVRGLRYEAQAVRRQSRGELEHDQRDGGADRDERDSPLRMHAASETEEPAEAGSSGWISELATSWRCRRGRLPATSSRRPSRGPASGGRAAAAGWPSDSGPCS